MALGNKKQRGVAAVIFAILLLAIIGFAALGLDIGMLYSQRTQAQRAADAGALAGAFTFVVDPLSPQPATATQHAIAAAANNTIDGAPVNAADVSVSVDIANRRVTVNLVHAENTFFARALGTSQVTINVRAIAEASPNPTGAYCVKPWFLPNTIVDAKDDPCIACQKGQVMISNRQITPFGQSQLGLQISVKPQNPANALVPSQFYIIDLTGARGANVYRQDIETCVNQSVPCGSPYNVEPGNKVGPTAQGVNALIGNPPDTYLSVGRYQHPNGMISDTSQSLVSIPVWDVCNYPGFCPGGNFPSGRNATVTVAGFALVFIEGIQGSNVVGRLINVWGCNGAPPSPETGPYSIPVRLVRTN